MNAQSTSRNPPDPEGFFRKAEEIGKSCLSFENPIIVHHLDCDGLTSGALAKEAFQKIGQDVPTLMLKKLDNDSVRLIPQEKDLVMTDLGAGQLELVDALANPKKAVLDHHPPSVPNSPTPRINCHDFGFDGSVDACSASTCYFAFRHVGVSSALGLTGVVGDLQDKNGLTGLNAHLLREAIEKNEVVSSRDLRIFGKVSRPLVSFLTYCTEPFLPGLTGNDKACAIFLKNTGIPTHREKKA
ncbi:MAG TPA: DHH family phosphoesterase, partial [Candidatus Norongarragalinales archaeon]|nr:DHH family phosphoesterase [Candidatus Norongarragalinales archaeon]